MKIHFRLAVTVLSGLALVGTTVWAQTNPGAPTAKKIYTRHMAFRLPVQISDKDRAGMDKIQLYVKEGPTEPWVCKETAQPTQPNFNYHVTHDGEYWFSVVTVDKSGRATPADVNREAPGLIVVVDTQPPDFEVHPFVGTNGMALVKCEIHDANPDYNQVKLEYKTDHGWEVLAALPDQQGTFSVPEASCNGTVRVTVADQAHNTTTREVSLKPVRPSPVLESSQVTVAPMESHSDKRVVDPALMPVSHSVLDSPRGQIINSTHASVDYQIDDVGPSGVGKVEVWMTRDEGQTWQRLCEDADRRSPAEIDLPGDGLYGITVVVSNGNGAGANPPARGDTPSSWVEVDTTRPEAQLLTIQPGVGEEAGSFSITWRASDKNLKTEPIDLYYATQRDGLWMPIARGLANSGSYHWSVPQGAGSQFYIRMEVSDRAGNVTRCEATQPVVLDSSKPKARVLGIAATSRSMALTAN